jgi:lipid A disaccharide synthetase
VADKQLVPELIQEECTAQHMATQLKRILSTEVNAEIQKTYLSLSDLLTSGGGAYTAAREIISDIGHTKR